MLDFGKLDKVYELYGYERIKFDDDLRVYRHRQGIYYGVDIIRGSTDISVDALRKDYADAGYATEIITSTSNKELYERIFNGFFESELTSKRLRRKYESYIEKQQKYFSDSYEYIPCPYRKVTSSNIENEANSGNIVNEIAEAIKRKGAELVIIEAAAGFGKTSTVYEILNKKTSNTEDFSNPIFIELSKSRNRQATIFSHVLLNEFEQAYPYLKYDLILHEIQTGKIPLIVDGFDELLYKRSRKDEGVGEFEDIQSMLYTIGEVITGNAKIILTTRKTAIFSGDEFFNWAEGHGNDFTTTRFLIEKPNIVNWIGDERNKKLELNNIPITSISNPVLLSYLRRIDDAEFSECCRDREQLIRGYFERLLLREQSRQELLMEPLEQINIFSNLAKSFVELGINSIGTDDKQFLVDLIVAENESILNHSSLRHNPSIRPKIEDIAETLTNHALLDRKGSFEDKIGFINDFVFGYMIAVSLCFSDEKWVEQYFMNESYVELAATAFKIRNSTHRKCLRSKINLIDDVLDQSTVLTIDLDLEGRPSKEFTNVTFGGLEADSVEFAGGCFFENCTFTDSSFRDTCFDRSVFKDVTFLNCTFSNCKLVNWQKAEGSVWILSGNDFGNGFIANMTKVISATRIDDSFDYEKSILEQFWLPGRDNYIQRRKIRTLYKGFPVHKKPLLAEAIDSLVKKGWIAIERDVALLRSEEIGSIKKKLGRAS